MVVGIIALVLYFVVYPLLTWLASFIHYKMRIEKLMNTKNVRKKLTPEQQQSLLKRWNEKIFFTMSDKRILTKAKDTQEAPKSGIQRRAVFFAIYGAGVAVSGAQFFIEDPRMFILSFAIYVAAMMFGVHSAKKLLAQRAKLLAKMFEIASKRLGYDAEASPKTSVRIKEWRDPITPSKVELDIPTNFAQEGEEGFIRQYNQVFGRETAWIADTDLEKGIEGWDYEKGVLSMRAVPPLPTRAAWDAKWVDHPGIAWSFFPLGLGVEDGVQLPGDNGEVYNVVGIDFSGAQPAQGEKAGVPVSTKITKTPMALIAGGTGGGKAMSRDTLVRRVVRKSI